VFALSSSPTFLLTTVNFALGYVAVVWIFLKPPALTVRATGLHGMEMINLSSVIDNITIKLCEKHSHFRLLLKKRLY
jgi:hypothetical protein